MSISSDTLRNNYYLAVIVYLCPDANYIANDPSTGIPWAFVLQDDGGIPSPNPYIATWDIKSPTQPTDDYMMANTTQDQLDACQAALYPPPDAALKKMQKQMEAMMELIKALQSQQLDSKSRTVHLLSPSVGKEALKLAERERRDSVSSGDGWEIEDGLDTPK